MLPPVALRSLPALAMVAALALAPSTARAEESPAPAPAPSRARRALAVGAALVPGVIVRGAGHWVAHDRRTAKRLLVLEGVGLGLAAAGGLPLGVSGGAGETLPGLVLLLPGAGLLFTTIAADAWGAAGGACLAGTPAPPSALDVALGYTFVGDPRVPFANLATADAVLRHGRATSGASGWFGDGTWRVRGALGARLRGPRPGQHLPDISALDVEVSAAEERRADQGLRVATVEAGALARVDLARIGPSLRGTFATLGMGVGGERIRYTATAAADTSSLFTAHLGWGFVLGDGRARALEAELYYEHRRDTLAGGLTPPTSANGFVGYVGAAATAWRDRWGVSARVEVGSAYVLSFAARVRLPEMP